MQDCDQSQSFHWERRGWATWAPQEQETEPQGFPQNTFSSKLPVLQNIDAGASQDEEEGESWRYCQVGFSSVRGGGVKLMLQILFYYGDGL